MYKKVIKENDPIISFIQNMREMDEAVIVDSAKLISKFIKVSRFKPQELFIKESLLETFEFEPAFDSITIISDDIFQKISGYNFSKGVLATFEKPRFKDLSEIKAPFIILNGLSSPENVGSIVRTMSGLGFKSLVIDSKTCSPFLRRCIRVSMGNINFIDVHRVEDLKTFIEKSNSEIFCAANEETSVSLYTIKPSRNSAFVIGSEGHGIDKDILEIVDNIIKIPVTEGVLHYNASIACAIIASEFSRQLSLVE